MTTVKRILFLVSFFAATAQLFASNGSIYSRFGVGEISSFISGRTAGMGNAGLALLTDGYINSVNPAALGRLTRTQYEGDFQYQGFAMNDGTSSSFLSSGNVQEAMLAFPVYAEYGMAFAFGITPFSRTAYSVKSKDTQAGQEILQSFDGNGGLTSAQFGFSLSPLHDLYLGLTTHYLFGTINRRQQLEFTGAQYFVSDETQSVAMKGFAFTLGAVYSGVDVALGASKEKNLNVAATLFGGSNLSASEQLIENYVSSRETTGVRSGTVKIPVGFALGAAYLIPEKAILTGDLRVQSWNDYNYLGVHPDEIRSSLRVGVGAEFFPTRTIGETFYRQVTYRIGSYMNASYVKVSNEPINEYFVTGGVGLPIFFIPTSEARLNVSLEYGIRGTTSNGLQKDSITRLTISLSGSDTWFVPPEIE